VRTVCARDIAITPGDLALLDARLACGDFEAVLAVLRTDGRAAALPLFLARYVRWSGDLHSAADIWPHVLAALSLTLEDEHNIALRRAVCTELAPVATDLGEVQLAARLHGIARALDACPLPGDADADTVMVGDVAFNTIGIDPDAARGRLRLRPRLDLLNELHVRRIRFGDGSVSLLAERRDAALSIHVEQDTGSIPITVLLEPFLTEPGSAMVDGRPAELIPRSVDGGLILPVQLVLDERRTLLVRARGAVAD
jgi:hypothetical protein